MSEVSKNDGNRIKIGQEQRGESDGATLSYYSSLPAHALINPSNRIARGASYIFNANPSFILALNPSDRVQSQNPSLIT